jgi:DNA-binding NarL/FixJ family response regulator
MVAIVGRGHGQGMIRVAIVDDHPAVLAGTRRLVAAEPDLLVAGAAPNPNALARQLDGVHPDVLILDHDLSRGAGLSQCRRVKSRPSPPAVIIYSAHATAALVVAARAAQADGVIDKNAPVAELLHAIRHVAEGGTVFPEVPYEAYRAAVSRLRDEDLPIFAMLLDREASASIAATLRCDPSEIGWRSQRIIGRLRPAAGRKALRPRHRRRRLLAEDEQAASASAAYRRGRRGQRA